MGSPQKPDDGLTVNTALAVTKDDMSALSLEQRALIAQRKNANIVSAQIAGTNWGKGLDGATQRAVSDWGQRHGIDVTTEIHILGGNIYLNAQFYINRLVDLVRAGKVLDFRQRFINVDKRLAEILNEVLPASASESARAAHVKMQDATRIELNERRHLRILNNVPEDADSAVHTEVILTALPHTPFIGVKWAPHGPDDPVGKKFPQETALTRSARRALKQCVRHLPEVARYVDDAQGDAAEHVEHLIAANTERTKGELAAAAIAENRQLHAGAAPGVDRMIPVPEYVAGAPSARRLTREEIERAANAPDPYVTAGTEHIETPFDTAPITEGASGPVTENLFGEHAPMEPTADERAAAEAAEEERIREEERRMVAEEEAAEKKRRDKRK